MISKIWEIEALNSAERIYIFFSYYHILIPSNESFLPVIIIGVFAAGLVYLALPVLIIVGIISMIRCAF